jgi:hypothetical protein
MSYDGKKNVSNYDDQLKFYATFDEGSCSLINIWREKKSVPVSEGKLVSKSSFIDKLNNPIMLASYPLGYLND